MATAVLEGTVREAAVDPLLRDRHRRWLVSFHVTQVVEGELAPTTDTGDTEVPEITLLVHSPSRDFASPDVVGRRYRLTLLDPIDDPAGPYTGRFQATPA